MYQLILVSAFLIGQAQGALQADLNPGKEELGKIYEELRQEIRTDKNINDFRDPKDEKAYEQFQGLTSLLFDNAVTQMGKIKSDLIRFSLLIQEEKDHDRRLILYKQYDQMLQERYNEVVNSFFNFAHEDLDGNLAKCKTEICVIELTKAYEEVVNFGQEMNQKISFDGLEAKAGLFLKFNSPLLKKSLDDWFTSKIPDNEDASAGQLVLAGLTAPFSVVGAASVGAFQSIPALKYRRERLQLEPIAKSRKSLRGLKTNIDDTYGKYIKSLSESIGLDVEVVAGGPQSSLSGSAECEEAQSKLEGLLEQKNLIQKSYDPHPVNDYVNQCISNFVAKIPEDQQVLLKNFSQTSSSIQSILKTNWGGKEFCKTQFIIDGQSSYIQLELSSVNPDIVEVILGYDDGYFRMYLYRNLFETTSFNLFDLIPELDYYSSCAGKNFSNMCRTKEFLKEIEQAQAAYDQHCTVAVNQTESGKLSSGGEDETAGDPMILEQ